MILHMKKTWIIGIFALSIFCAPMVLSHECDEDEDNTSRSFGGGARALHLCASSYTTGSYIDNFLPTGVSSGDSTDSATSTEVNEVIVTGERLNRRVLGSITARELKNKVRMPALRQGMEEIVVTAERRSDCERSGAGSRLNASAGNPSSAITGFKSLFERDYVAGDRLLSFIRRYDGSRINNISALGRGWVTPLFGFFTTMPYIFIDDETDYDDAWDDWEILRIGDSLAAYSFLVKFDEDTPDDVQIAHRPYYLNYAELRFVDDHFELIHETGQKSLFHLVGSAE